MGYNGPAPQGRTNEEERMYLNVNQVAALNAAAAAIPGLEHVMVRDDEGVEHLVVRVGVGGGWMVDPPSPSCAARGHESGSDPRFCLWCEEEL